jgi:hypothetical protein
VGELFLLMAGNSPFNGTHIYREKQGTTGTNPQGPIRGGDD